jgi:hypothetical protein
LAKGRSARGRLGRLAPPVERDPAGADRLDGGEPQSAGQVRQRRLVCQRRRWIPVSEPAGFLGIDAENKALEDVAEPLSFAGDRNS